MAKGVTVSSGIDSGLRLINCCNLRTDCKFRKVDHLTCYNGLSHTCPGFVLHFEILVITLSWGWLLLTHHSAIYRWAEQMGGAGRHSLAPGGQAQLGQC